MPPNLIATFAQGIFFGKLRTYASLVFLVRLENTDKRTGGADAIQVLINDVARVITGCTRVDRTRIQDLLDKAGLLSLNQIVGQDAGKLAWAMTNPSHPLHQVYLESCLTSTTRSAANGLIRATSAKGSIGVYNAQRVWNSCPELREAKSARSAREALRKFARTLPLV